MMSYFASRPSGALRVSRRILNTRPFKRTSELINSKGIYYFLGKKISMIIRQKPRQIAWASLDQKISRGCLTAVRLKALHPQKVHLQMQWWMDQYHRMRKPHHKWFHLRRRYRSLGDCVMHDHPGSFHFVEFSIRRQHREFDH